MYGNLENSSKIILWKIFCSFMIILMRADTKKKKKDFLFFLKVTNNKLTGFNDYIWWHASILLLVNLLLGYFTTDYIKPLADLQRFKCSMINVEIGILRNILIEREIKCYNYAFYYWTATIPYKYLAGIKRTKSLKKRSIFYKWRCLKKSVFKHIWFFFCNILWI